MAKVNPDSDEGHALVLIETYRDLPEALLAKGSLVSAGIESFLADDNTVRMDWLWSNLLGGVKLLVAPEDEEDAREILNQAIPESLELEGAENYLQPRCPKCGSLDVNFQELYKPIAFASLLINFPLPVHREGWFCQTCSYSWMETESASNEPTPDKPSFL